MSILTGKPRISKFFALQFKPNALPVIPENIPPDLKTKKRWIVWRYTWSEQKQKWDKPPLQISGKAARVNCTGDWVSFDVAYSHYRQKGFDGIGYVPDEADGLVFLDLDNVVNSDGALKSFSQELRSRFSGAVPEPAELVAQFGYVELSPSGSGLRFVCRGTLPPGRRLIGGKGQLCPDGVEMYSHHHYLTVTGQRLPQAPALVEDCTAGLAALHLAVFGPEAPESPASARGPLPATALDDLALIEKARFSKGGEKFLKLWNGDASDYQSRSEADFALAGKLAFWTGGNPGQIERLMRQSRLARPKWDRRHYLEKTIANALKKQRDFYNPVALRQTSRRVAGDCSCPNYSLLCEEEVRRNRDNATLLQGFCKVSEKYRSNPWDCPYCFGVAGELRGSPALIPAPCGKRSCPVCGPHWRQVSFRRFGTHICNHTGTLFVDRVADWEWQSVLKGMRREAKARGVALRFVAIRDEDSNMTVIASVPPTEYGKEADKAAAIRALEKAVDEATIEPRAYSACRPWGKIEEEPEAKEKAVRVPGGASRAAFSATVKAWGAETVDDRAVVIKCSVDGLFLDKTTGETDAALRADFWREAEILDACGPVAAAEFHKSRRRGSSPAADCQHEYNEWPDPNRPGWLVTTCRGCGQFYGRRPESSA